MPFDPYESLLRNFSKHKFKLFVEESILSPESYRHSQNSDAAEVFKEHWLTEDIAHMDMPTHRDVPFGIYAYNRWIFQLDHFEDGIIKPESVCEHAQLR